MSIPAARIVFVGLSAGWLERMFAIYVHVGRDPSLPTSQISKYQEGGREDVLKRVKIASLAYSKQ